MPNAIALDVSAGTPCERCALSMPFPERKIQGRHSAERPVVRAAPTAGAPGTTARGRLAPRLNPPPRQPHTLLSLADLPPRHCRGCGSLDILLRRMKHPPRLWLPAAACRPAAR